jgi:hypothetical protein
MPLKEDKVINETRWSYPDGSGYQIALQQVEYHYTNGTQDDGFRFMNYDAAGNLKLYPHGQRLPSLAVALTLIAQAVDAGWGGRLTNQVGKSSRFEMSHVEQWRRRYEQQPLPSVAVKFLNSVNPWTPDSYGYRLYQVLLREQPTTLAGVYAIVRPLEIKTALTEREIWKHIAWLDTWCDAPGFPFIQIGD